MVREFLPAPTVPRVRPVVTLTLLLPLVAVLSLATATTAAAEALSLERAVELAVEHNLTLEAATARVEAADAGLAQARAGRLPTVKLQAAAVETDHPAQVFSSKLAQGVFGADDFQIERLNDPGAWSSWQSRLSLQQPLWTGGRLGHGIAAAEAALGAAEAGREATRQQIVHATIEAWTAVVVGRARVDVAHASAKTAESSAKIVGDLRHAGLVVASDELQAQVRLAEVREMIAMAEADAATAEARLRWILGGSGDGSGGDGELTLPEGALGQATAADPALDLAELLAEAEASRPSLAAQRLQAQAAAEQVLVARAGRLPEVGVEAWAERNDGDFFFTGDGGGSHYGVVVGLRLDLFDPARRARVAEAEARRREAEARREEFRQQVEVEIVGTYHRLGALDQRRQQVRRAVELAERNLEIVRDRYQNGLAVITELLDAETTLTGARLRRLATEGELRVARAGLDLAVGRL